MAVSPMLTFAAPNGDLEFRIEDGLQSVIQRVQQRLRFFRRTWFLDQSAGVPWLTDVFSRASDLAVARRAIAAAVSTVPDVVSVTEIRIDTSPASEEQLRREPRLARTIAVEIDLVTRFGAATASGSL